MEVKITSKGDFNKTFKFLEKMKNFQIRQILERYGQEGVSALSSATQLILELRQIHGVMKYHQTAIHTLFIGLIVILIRVLILR